MAVPPPRQVAAVPGEPGGEPADNGPVVGRRRRRWGGARAVRHANRAGVAHAGDYNDAMPETTPPGGGPGAGPSGGSAAGGGSPRPLTIESHARRYRENHYVYPVLSRRARGISVGINLNPDTICNFDCIYCQVDRRTPPSVRTVDEDRLRDELRATLAEFRSGELFGRPEFAGVPGALRVLRDITFAGDGEPPSYPNFTGMVRDAIRIKQEEGFPALKVILLTNATLIDRPRVQEAMRLIDEDGGEHWLKLDAGTEAYYRIVDRTTVPFARVLANILEAARRRPIVVQSLFMRLHGEPPPVEEVASYCARLRTILDGGGRVRLVQVYTVARPPAESWVTPLADAQVDAIASEVRRLVPEVAVETFYSGRVGD